MAWFLSILLYLFFCSVQSDISVVTVLPNGDNPVLSNRESITVFFSKPVIALGSDFGSEIPDNLQPITLDWPANVEPIPGQTRWVTTSIARFDPDVDWPPYLRLTLRISITRNFQNEPILVPSPIIYSTGPVTMIISKVSSEITNTSSGGFWDPSMSIPSPDYSTTWYGPEVPPDGNIFVSFSTDIDIVAIGDALSITETEEPTELISFTVNPCPQDTRCVVVTPQRFSLQQDKQYTLTLNSGFSLNRYAGPVTDSIEVNFYGLYGFRFSFRTVQPSQQRLRLFVRHGLFPGTTETALLNSFHLIDQSSNNPVSILVSSPERHVIEIIADIVPSTSYLLTIISSSSVKDAWGIPISNQQTQFTTQKRASFVLNARPSSDHLAQFEDIFPFETWTVVGQDVSTKCGGRHGKIEFTNINSGNITSAIATLFSSYDSYISGGLLVDAEGNTSFDIPWGTSGAFIVNSYLTCYTPPLYKQSYIVSQTSIGVTALAVPHRITIWVTNTTTAQLISSASVQLYAYSSGATAKLVASSTTDENGIASLNYTGHQGNGAVVVAVGQKIQIVTLYLSPFIPSIPSNTQVALIIDRGFYKPGDTIYVKGYIRSFMQGTMTVPTGPFVIAIQWNSNSMTVSPTTSIITNPQESQIPIDNFNTSFGSFHTAIPIPNTADPGQKMITIKDANGNYLHSESFLIATPRIPTVEMSFTSTMSFYQLGSPLPLHVTLSTYTGANIAGAEITLTYKVTKYSPPIWLDRDFQFGLGVIRPTQPSFDRSGEIRLPLTNAQGSLNYYLDLESLLNTTIPEGAVATLTAKYFSATGEEVTQSLSLTVAFSQYALKVRTSFSDPTTIWPSLPFGIFAGLVDINSDDPLSNVEATFALYAEQTIPSATSTGAVLFTSRALKTCTCTLSGSSTFCCPGLELPNVGRHYLLATAKLPGSPKSAVTLMFLGQSQQNWAASPIKSYNNINVELDSVTYSAGSTVTINFYNPFRSGAIALVQWGCSTISAPLKTRVYSSLPPPTSDGSTKLTFTLGDESPIQSFVDVTLVLVAPRVPSRMEPNLGVPVSIMYDTNGPVKLSSSFQIQIVRPPDTLSVEVSMNNPIALPGSQVSITIQVSKENSPVSNAEVALFVVDKAALDLVPIEPVHFDERLANPYIYSQISEVHSSFDVLGYAASYKKILQVLLERFEANPWALHEDWPLYPSPYPNNLDLSLIDYFNLPIYKQNSWLTNSPISFFPRPLAFPMLEKTAFRAMAAADASVESFGILSDTAGSSLAEPQSSSITARTNFVTTAYFSGRLITDQNGKVHVSFKLPDNLGTFEIRAYAITTDAHFGFASNELVVRRELSMQYSGPTVVRVGDKFKAGVAITASSPQTDDDIVVEVFRPCDVLDILGSYNLSSPPGIITHIRGSGPHLVTFTFQALGVGQVPLGWRVRYASSQNFADIALFNQTATGQQEPVYIATSMAISSEAEITEGFAPPPAAPYSGSVEINIGIGRLPAVQAFSGIVYSRIGNENQNWVSSEDHLAYLISQFSIQQYSQLVNYTAVEDVVNKLKLYTDSTLGLQYYTSNVFQFKYTSVTLQALALFVKSLITQEGGILEGGQPLISESSSDTLDALSDSWILAMNNELASQTTFAHTHNSTIDYNTLAFVYLATGLDWVPPHPDLSLQNLIENIRFLSVDSVAALILAIDRDMSKDKPSTTMMINLLINNIRVQGQTAYISTGSGQQNPAFVGTALGLIDFLSNSVTDIQIDKIANFIAQVDSTSKIWYSSSQLCYFMLSLSFYDKENQNTQPDLNVSVININSDSTNNVTTLLNVSYTSALDPSVKKSYAFEDINTITFIATGSGEASVVFGASFVPLKVSPEPVYRGINVNKVIQHVNPVTFEPVGPPISNATLGQTVRVTIEVTIPDYSEFLCVVDPFPGAIQPLDSNIYQVGESNIPVVWNRYTWWNPPVTVNYLPDKVVFLSANLYAGTHTFSYVALVSGAGEFVVGPALAYDRRQPELMGLSAGSAFITNPIGTPPKLGRDNTCFPWSSRGIDPEVLSNFMSATDNSVKYIQSSIVVLILVFLSVGVVN